MQLEIGAALGLATALVVLVARRTARAWSARRRGRLAARGEREAEALLEAHGYRIEARQATGAMALEVDGARETAEVRCDLLVTRRGRRFVAEVKTGRLAPRLDHAPTRRQLLEYRLAFGVDGVILVDAGTGRVRQVSFPALRAPLPVAWLAAAAGLGAVAAWALFR